MEDKKIPKSTLDDLGNAKALIALKNLEGGKILIAELSKKLTTGIEKLIYGYDNLSELEIKCILAKLENNVFILKKISQAESNSKLIEQSIQNL